MNNDLYIPDSLFPTDNDFEVPSLRLDMQATTCQIPFVCFGEQKRTFKMNGTGTLHFYTDDYRFNAVYEHPEKILQQNPAQIVEPNFSLFNETPIAFGLQAIYKKRLVARQMQEEGIRVFVDLNVAKIGSLAMQKAIRQSDNKKQFIAVTCHFDVIEWLQPDWIFNTNDMTFSLYSKKKDQTSLYQYTKYQQHKTSGNIGKCLANIII
jgi:hypothetical protein